MYRITRFCSLPKVYLLHVADCSFRSLLKFNFVVCTCKTVQAGYHIKLKRNRVINPTHDPSSDESFVAMCRTTETRTENVYAKAVETNSGKGKFVSGEIISDFFCRGITIENMRQTYINSSSSLWPMFHMTLRIEIKSNICNNVCFVHNKMDIIIRFM